MPAARDKPARVPARLGAGPDLDAPRGREVTARDLRRPEHAAIEIEPRGSERTDEPAERRRLGAAIAAGVAALPDAQRAVLVLREYHDLDYQEIADVLELDLGTVKSRLARGRTALRDHLVIAMPELGGRS